MVGNTAHGSNPDNGTKYKVFYKEGGELTFNMENGFYDEGTWKIDGDKICLKWNRIRRGQLYCLSGFTVDGDKVAYTNEADNSKQVQTIAPGISRDYR